MRLSVSSALRGGHLHKYSVSGHTLLLGLGLDGKETLWVLRSMQSIL